jgi:formate--tetrahydrofolate ligase
MPTDIEIAQAANLKPIVEVAEESLGIPAPHLVPYGH